QLLACTGIAPDELLEAEVEEQAALFGTADFAEGRAAFAERRPPRFEGR
ncbi:enoyl-CoA hydratase, partial [Micromonospora aurantiaca]|nr:enoyl-CoA hydratase [Micromonospora aurantiaca]